MPNQAKSSATSSRRRGDVKFALTDRTNTNTTKGKGKKTEEKDKKNEVRKKFKCKKCPSSFDKKEYLEKHVRDEACVPLDLRGPKGKHIRTIFSGLKIDPSAPIDDTPPAENTRSKTTL